MSGWVRFRAILLLLLLFTFSGCSSPDKKAVYENTVTAKPLIVPPDMVAPEQNSALYVPIIAPDETSYNVYTSKKTNTGVDILTVESSGIRLARDGAIRWLELDIKAKVIWKHAIEFMEKTGFKIIINNPKLGIIETNWIENRANEQGNWFSKLISQIQNAGLMDKYRIRIERNSANNKTLMFLTHQGLRENNLTKKDGEVKISWLPRAADPELEYEMYIRFLLYLGSDEKQVEKVFASDKKVEIQQRTQLVEKDGLSYLKVTEIFSRSWRRTGLAIDRLGFIPEDRDRSAGIYYIKVTDSFIKAELKEDSWFSQLFKSEQDTIRQFIISIEDKGDFSEIRILTRQGDEDKSPLQKRILEKLQLLLK